LLVTVDALRADSQIGIWLTDRLAKGGATHTTLTANASWTLPSLASLLTGTTEHHAGIGPAGFVALEPTTRTITRAFAEAGYRTVAILGDNPFVGQEFGLAAHFDEVQHPRSPTAWPLPRGRNAHGRPRPLAARIVPRPPPSADATSLVSATNIALHDDRSTFVWLHLMDLHLPYASSPCRAEVLTVAPVRPKLVADDHWQTDAGASCWHGAYWMAASRLEATIRDLDVPVGTVVLITSDHGEALGGDEGIEHGQDAPVTLTVPLHINQPWSVAPNADHAALGQALMDLAQGRTPIVPSGSGVTLPALYPGG
jgi:hypothetical protein